MFDKPLLDCVLVFDFVFSNSFEAFEFEGIGLTGSLLSDFPPANLFLAGKTCLSSTASSYDCRRDFKKPSKIVPSSSSAVTCLFVTSGSCLLSPI